MATSKLAENSRVDVETGHGLPHAECQVRFKGPGQLSAPALRGSGLRVTDNRYASGRLVVELDGQRGLVIVEFGRCHDDIQTQ
jgi:hypothetical protein